jgi:hypothetical protein
VAFIARPAGSALNKKMPSELNSCPKAFSGNGSIMIVEFMDEAAALSIAEIADETGRGVTVRNDDRIVTISAVKTH